MDAFEILKSAGNHMKDRASTYDREEGERSMTNVVDCFNIITGYGLTIEQGWLFMVLLKAVRSQQGLYSQDSYEDGAAYFALAGEAAFEDRLACYPAQEEDHSVDYSPWDDGINWIARNNNGTWFGFSNKPSHSDVSWGCLKNDAFVPLENPKIDRYMEFHYGITSDTHWTNTLTKRSTI